MELTAKKAELAESSVCTIKGCGAAGKCDRLNESIFKSFSAWHSQWLVNKALNAA
jgi:hypothetical protein